MVERTGFSEELKRLRAEADLSQAGLAKASGIPLATIRQWEYGIREPTLAALVRLAKGLEISLAAFDGLEVVKATRPAGRPRKTEPPAKPKTKRKGKA